MEASGQILNLMLYLPVIYINRAGCERGKVSVHDFYIYTTTEECQLQY